MSISKITNAPTPNEHIAKTNEIIEVVNNGGGTATDVQINGASITSNNIANIVTNTAYDSSTNKIATMSDVFSRNIGEIVQSTIPLTDAGLHLLDGSLLSGDGVYSDFVDYIASIYNANLNYFCTESDWQTSVTTYGVCGKFVYDSTNDTVRLPRIIGFTEGEINTTNLGDLTEAGLPNITGYIRGYGGGGYSSTGAFTTSTADSQGWGDSSGKNRFTFELNASMSSSIYGNSTTVQPQSIKVLYYIVVANSTKTEIEVDIDNVATDLNILNGELNRRSASYLTESYVNGTSGYRVYSDKWCVQWGTSTISNGNNGLEVTLTKSYSDTNFCVLVTHREGSYSTIGMCANVTAKNKIKIFYNNTSQRIMQWQTSGYLP